MDNFNNNQSNFGSIPESKTPDTAPRVSIAVVVILSLLFGILGGSLSSYYFLRSGLSGQPAATIRNQQVTLDEDSAIIDVVKKASPAVVSIIISQDLSKVPGYGLDPNQYDPFYFFFGGRQMQPQPQASAPNVQEVGAGSGFFVSPDGLILTNKHVVADDTASYTVITSDGKSYTAKVLAKDPLNDLAVVKIDIHNAPYLSFADSSKLQIGQRVVAIGNSLGQYQNTVTSGIVSGIGRSVTAGGDNQGTEQLSGVIQTDAAINPGNSGGPLLNVSGQVVGVNTAIDQQGQLVGFAIPSRDAQRDINSFQTNGKIINAYLGVRYVMVTPTLAQQQNLGRDYGALLVHGQGMTDYAVVPGSPADNAGLVENDIILQVNGQKVDQDNILSSVLKNYGPGDTVTMRVFHRGSEKDVKVTLGESK
ncbi:MAG: trypsin-like peptidase domain-containing protein [Patescibacteria group bacterium]|nr:trypsin-like peptidase domain-containing protein [Patescibacteria group bacterium]